MPIFAVIDSKTDKALIAVLSADLVNSRALASNYWLPPLREALRRWGCEPADWELYRGDSFQLALPPKKALEAVFHIKASLRQIRPLDLRVGLGLGQAGLRAERVSASQGPAWIHSGTCYDQLGKQTLAMRSDKPKRDRALNLMFSLYSLTADQWTPVQAAVVQAALEHPDWNQQDLGAALQRSQSTISEALNRAGYAEWLQLNRYFQEQMEDW